MAKLFNIALAGQYPPLNNRINHFDRLLAQKVGDSGVITTATGNPVSIVTNRAQNAISTLLSYSPKQSGTGTPSPQNVRPIDGWTEANLGINSETPTKTISLGGTYYGFTVDVERGVLRVTHDLGTYTSGWNHASNGVFYMDNRTVPYGSVAKNASLYECIKNVVNSTTGALAYPKKICQQYITNYTRWLVYDPDITTESDFNDMISDNPLQIAYELATPLELPLTPQTVALLKGNNTLWTDGDEITITYKAKR